MSQFERQSENGQTDRQTDGYRQLHYVLYAVNNWLNIQKLISNSKNCLCVFACLHVTVVHNLTTEQFC